MGEIKQKNHADIEKEFNTILFKMKKLSIQIKETKDSTVREKLLERNRKLAIKLVSCIDLLRTF